MQKTSFDVIAVGDATIDAFLSIQNANDHCRVDDKACELCFPIGDKIPLESSAFLLGGNACNLAVGLSRLGLTTSLCAELGNDEFAHKIVYELSKEQVDRSLLIVTKHAKSSFAIGVNFKGDRTLFVQHVTREHNFNLDGVSAKWIYLTSIGHKWKDAYQRVHDFIKRADTKLAFAPGTYQIDGGFERIAYILKETDILFLNKEEGAKIANCKYQISNKEGMEKLLHALQKLGPKTVVLTDGIKGSYTLDEKGKTYFQKTFPDPIVERTGAGDAYATGFLAGVMQGESIQNAMTWGTINAGAVVGVIGAQPGLLTKEKISERLSKLP
ncbi:MAG TPA: carbohydrate kinase family protein [Candidatus Saccharimonadales bacterium]|nr:carbohydrate kinase family protein [Candidatus Saccharimonadales bacterium]